MLESDAELGSDAELSVEAALSARRRFRTGLILGAGVAVVLMTGTDLPAREALALPLFLVVLPAIAWAQLPLLTEEALERIPVYLGSIVSITLLGLLALGLGVWGFEPDELGLVAVSSGTLLGWAAVITAAALLLGKGFEPLDEAVHGGPHPVLVRLLPRTLREKGVFVGLSLTAGWGEEVAYRGYLPAALLVLIPDPWLAMGLASLAFGGLHSYQGGVGVVRTAIMGFLLGVPVIVTGSLLPGMVAHALVDLIAGLVLAPRILRRVDSSKLSEHVQT